MADREKYPTQNSLSEDVRNRMCQLLNQHLANTFDLYSQTKQAHWNVKGSHFYQDHLLFDELAEQVFKHIDTLAERVNQLGGVAKGTVRMASSSSQLQEFPSGGIDDIHSMQELSQRYAQLGASARSAIETASKAGDEGTADIFIEMVRDLDKALWFLEAHLQQAGQAGLRKAA